MDHDTVQQKKVEVEPPFSGFRSHLKNEFESWQVPSITKFELEQVDLEKYLSLLRSVPGDDVQPCGSWPPTLSTKNEDRIFWSPNSWELVRHFQLLTVMYGTACAPYLPLRTLRQLCDVEGDKFPRARLAALRDRDVDDVLSGADDVEDALTLRNELIQLRTIQSLEKSEKIASSSRKLCDRLENEILNQTSRASNVILYVCVLDRRIHDGRTDDEGTHVADKGRGSGSKVVEREPVSIRRCARPRRRSQEAGTGPRHRESDVRSRLRGALMSMISEAVRSEVNRALGERAKPPVEVAGADVFGALSNSGLRNLPTEGGRPGETPRKSQAPVKAPRKWPRASSTPWDIGAMTVLPCGTLQLNDVSSDGEDLADAQERVKWDDAQRNLKQEDTGALDRSYARAEQRWKYVRLLRETGLRFSGTNDEMGAETFLSRLERYRRRGGIPTDDLLFAVEAVLVDEAAVWYESVEHKVKTWQDFERRFRRSFASQATTDELLTELRQRTQGKGEPISTYLNNFRFLCSRFRVPLPYENQLAIAFRGIRPEYRNFMAHRQITSFSELEQAGKEFENVNRMNAYWHEPIVSASQHYPSAAYKPTERSQLAAVQTERARTTRARRRRKGEEDAKIAAQLARYVPVSNASPVEEQALSRWLHRDTRAFSCNSVITHFRITRSRSKSCHGPSFDRHWSRPMPIVHFPTTSQKSAPSTISTGRISTHSSTTLPASRSTCSITGKHPLDDSSWLLAKTDHRRPPGLAGFLALSSQAPNNVGTCHLHLQGGLARSPSALFTSLRTASEIILISAPRKSTPNIALSVSGTCGRLLGSVVRGLARSSDRTGSRSTTFDLGDRPDSMSHGTSSVIVGRQTPQTRSKPASHGRSVRHLDRSTSCPRATPSRLRPDISLDLGLTCLLRSIFQTSHLCPFAPS
ncbi:unnamed protein product [Trichogramma brassicae]|uniref:Retrotransposon gag domain-containing protein n=1 Tax=Trichogramma brassicae TaxID=86971 RepID=A0A6H5IL34_9HYME|nr:unnamed protein product [Trichogramma brassicae]